MRALVILLALIPSIAVAQAPPSKTLERAIKLYDKQDFFSATVEAKKVIEGESGDTPENVARARFFLAKSLYQIKFHAASLAKFHVIIHDDSPYKSASWKWIAALRKVIPDAMLVAALSSMTDADLDDPILQSVREDLIAIRAAKNPAPFDRRQIVRDALGCTHPDPARMREHVQKLRGFDDNPELVQAVRMLLRANDVYAQTLDLAMQRTPPVRDARQWVGVLKTELELLSQSDRAWQTTWVAAEVLQELTIHHSIGEADLGARVREMLDAMEPEISTIGSYSTPPDRCSRGAATALAGTPSTTPMVVQPKPHGCGCATGGSPDGGLLVVLLAVAFRRKSRAASGTRSPRA